MLFPTSRLTGDVGLVALVIHRLSDEQTELPARLLVGALSLLHQDSNQVLLRIRKVLGVEVTAPIKGAETPEATLGLPLIRASVDHGTALDLAGTGKADAGSLRAALQCALDLAERSVRRASDA